MTVQEYPRRELNNDPAGDCLIERHDDSHVDDYITVLNDYDIKMINYSSDHNKVDCQPNWKGDLQRECDNGSDPALTINEL